MKATSDSEDSGAGMIGTLEFSSATYYRYCALNLDLLSDHLAELGLEERRKVVAAFLCSVIESIPSARQNSMNAHVRPGYVLGTFKAQGQPVQLVNAFENPVRANGSGFMEVSVSALKAELSQLQLIWNVTADTKVAIPDIGIDEFIKTLTAHVS